MDLLDNFLDGLDKKRRSVNFSPLAVDPTYFVQRRKDKEELPPRPSSVAFVRDCLFPRQNQKFQIDLEKNGGWTLIVSEDEDFILPTRPLCVFLDISERESFSKTTKHGIQKFRLPLPSGFHNAFSRIVLDTPKIDVETLRPLLIEGGRIYTQLPFEGERREDVFLTHYRTDKPVTRKIGLNGKAMWVIKDKTMYDTLSFKLKDRDYVKYASYRLKNDIPPYSEVSDGEMATAIRGKAPNVRILTQHTEGDCWYAKCNCRQVRDRIYTAAEQLFQEMKETNVPFTAASCQQFILHSSLHASCKFSSLYQVDQLVDLIMWFKQNSDVNEAKIAADLYTSALENNIAFTREGVEEFIRTSNTNDDKVSHIALEILKLHQLTQSQALNFYNELRRRCVKFPSRYDVSLFVQRSDPSLSISKINFIVDTILNFTVFDELNKSDVGVDEVRECVNRIDPSLSDDRLYKIVSDVFNNLKVYNERPEVIAEELYKRMNGRSSFAHEDIRQFVVDAKPQLKAFEVETLVTLIQEKYESDVLKSRDLRAKELSDKNNAIKEKNNFGKRSSQAKRGVASTVDRLANVARIHNLATSIHNKIAGVDVMTTESFEGTSSPVSDFIKDVDSKEDIKQLKKAKTISTYEDPELELVEIPQQIDVSYVTYENFSVTSEFLENFSSNLRKLYADKIIRYSAIIKQLELDLARMNAIIEKTGNKNASLHNIREMFPSYTHTSTHIHSIRSIIDTLNSRLLAPYQLERKFRKILSSPTKGIASIVGRTEIKDHICRVLYAFSKDHRSLINSFGTLSLLGNAGIGKTALMKVIGYALSRSGILVRKSFKVVSRHDLISQFLGSTAHHTRDVLMSSLEGVVGIDECHALVTDTSRDYGGESISELVRFVDEFIGLMYMVVCGYTEPMERMFFGQNEGLNRRFPMKFILGDYTSRELTFILLRHLHRFGMKLKQQSINVMFTLISRRQFPNQAGDMLNLATRIHTLLMCHLSTDIEVEAQVLIQCLN